MEEDKSCWECSYNKIGGDSFLGRCKVRSLEEIPPHIVDKGCSKWISKWKKVESKQLSLIKE